MPSDEITISGKNFAVIADGNYALWKELVGVKVVDSDYGSGSILEVELRSEKCPIITLQFDGRHDVTRFNSESFKEDTTSIVVDATRGQLLAELTNNEARRALEAAERKVLFERKVLLNRASGESLYGRPRLNIESEQERRSSEIRRIAEARGVKCLMHFTPLENVSSILERGIIARKALLTGSFIPTDEFRADGWLNWVSLSVSFPNYKMFWSKQKLQQKSLIPCSGWAILLIAKEVLWELNARFFLTNAARATSQFRARDYWSSPKAFEEMFSYTQFRHQIPDRFTTDPQAEVMVESEVPVRFIRRVTVPSAVEETFLRERQGVLASVLPEIFQPRVDFEQWQKRWLDPVIEDEC